MPMVEAKFRFLQMPIECLPGDPVELGQTSFGEAPERFDPVDVIGIPGEFILSMMDPEMLVESHVDQAVVPAPSVGVNEALRIGLPRITAWRTALLALGTISVYTRSPRFRSPKTIVFPPAPRPLFPRIR